MHYVLQCIAAGIGGSLAIFFYLIILQSAKDLEVIKRQLVEIKRAVEHTEKNATGFNVNRDRIN